MTTVSVHLLSLSVICIISGFASKKKTNYHSNILKIRRNVTLSKEKYIENHNEHLIQRFHDIMREKNAKSSGANTCPVICQFQTKL